jgi:acyl-coenzyme A thioesterase PaaI-like protein
MTEPSLQRRYGAKGICFGCGPANDQGLQIASFPQGDEVVCDWGPPQAHHQAFPGMLNGGIIGALLDCHCNWTAAWAIHLRDPEADFPCTVTADFHVKLRRPTPADRPLRLRAWIAELTGPKAIVESEMTCDGNVTARCTGTFVAVGPEHPAYHRW